jgi:hypothetical protein
MKAARIHSFGPPDVVVIGAFPDEITTIRPASQVRVFLVVIISARKCPGNARLSTPFSTFFRVGAYAPELLQ